MAEINGLNSVAASYEKPVNNTPKVNEEVKQEKDSAKSLSTNDKLQTYTVKKGDTLWGISKDKLGNPQKWVNVFELNKDQIKDPNLIHPNQVLKLPIKIAEPEQPAVVDNKPEEPTIKPEPKPIDNKPAVVDNKPTEKPDEKPVVDNKPSVVDNKPVEQPTKPALTVRKLSVAKSSAVGFAVGTGLTAGTFIAITSKLAYPASNLGGYATAQIVAKNLGKVGISLGSITEVSKMVKAVGGPKAAGTIAAVGVGVLVAGATAGGVYLYNKHHENK
ncbi:MAG: LysM peptidoglycan-binding domain-containing protein [Candidatus Sericytochromatia bacterium]